MHMNLWVQPVDSQILRNLISRLFHCITKISCTLYDVDFPVFIDTTPVHSNSPLKYVACIVPSDVIAIMWKIDILPLSAFQVAPQGNFYNTRYAVPQLGIFLQHSRSIFMHNLLVPTASLTSIQPIHLFVLLSCWCKIQMRELPLLPYSLFVVSKNSSKIDSPPLPFDAPRTYIEWGWWK